MNGKLPANLFDNKAFRKGERMERIYMHLVDPWRYQLEPNEDAYLKMLEKAWTIICENPSRTEARRLILAIVLAPVSDSRRGNTNNISGIQIMRDCENLFGRFEDVNKRVQRGRVRERISLRLQVLYANAAEGADNDKFIAKYEELLIKLDGLDGIIDAKALDTSLPEISFTSDPSALINAEDAEFEEE